MSVLSLFDSFRIPLFSGLIILASVLSQPSLAEFGTRAEQRARGEAMFYSRDQKMKTDISVDISDRIYKAVLHRTGDFKKAARIALAANQYGRQVATIYASGGSFAQRKEIADAALAEFTAGAAKVLGSGTKHPGMRFTLSAVNTLASHYAEKGKSNTEPNRDPNLLLELQRDPEKAARWAEANARDAASSYHGGQRLRLAYGYTHKEFMESYERMSPKEKKEYAKFYEHLTDFKYADSIDDLMANNSDWADQKHTKQIVKMLEENFWRLKELETNILGIDDRTRLIQAQVQQTQSLVQSLTKDLDTSVEVLRDLRNEMRGKLDDLKNAQSEQEARAIQVEIEQIAQKTAQARQRVHEEKISTFSAAAGLLDQFGALVPNDDFKTLASTLSQFTRIGQQFYELQMTIPVSGFGQAALTMNYVGLGMQLASMVIGGQMSGDQQILAAIAQLTELVTERFNKLDNTLISQHSVVMDQFRQVQVAINDLRNGVFDARRRLQGLQVSLNELALNLSHVRTSEEAYRKSDLWYALYDLESEYFVNRGKNLTLSDFNTAFAKFVTAGVQGSVAPAFLKPKVELSNTTTMKAAEAMFASQLDPYESVDAIFTIAASEYGLENITTNRIPNGSYWRRAALNYLKAFDRNRTEFAFTLDSEHDLTQLLRSGRLIEKAMVEGRSRERIKTILDDVEIRYEKSVDDIMSAWKSFSERILLSVPATTIGVSNAFQAPGNPAGEYYREGKAARDERFASQKLSKTSIQTTFVGSEKPQHNDVAWNFVPPVVRGLLHYTIRSFESESDAEKLGAVNVRVRRTEWRLKNIKKKLMRRSTGTGPHWWRADFYAYPVLEVQITGRLLDKPITYTISGDVPALSGNFQINHYSWKHKEKEIRFGPLMIDKLNDDFHEDMMLNLEKGWAKGIAMSLLEKTPQPWPNTVSEEISEKIVEIMQSLLTRFAQDIELMVKTPTNEYRAVQPDLLHATTSGSINQDINELYARAAFVQRNLSIFAPDFLVADGAVKDTNAYKLTIPSREAMEKAVSSLAETYKAGIYVSRELMEAAPRHHMIRRLVSQLGLSNASRLQMAYSKYIEDLGEQNAPQCQAMSDTLERIEVALELNKDFQRVVEMSDRMISGGL